MKKNVKKIFFLGFICFFNVLNVYAKQKNQMFGAIVTKKLDSNNALCYGKFGFFLNQLFKLVRFAVPVIIIALTIVDFVKAMSAQNQDEIKKAFNKLISRIIVGVIIFVLPTLIDFLIGIANPEFGTTCGY